MSAIRCRIPDLRRSETDILKTAALFLALLAVEVALQVWLGAYAIEFSSDDASHYVTGLMIRDWLASGAYRDPLGYATAYHVHYPVIGLGLWGPAFYGIEALWMLLFGSGRIAVLLLSAAVTAAIGAIVATLAARRGHWSLGLAAAMLFLLAAPVIESSGSVMLDLPITLASLLAVLCYCRFLARPSWGGAAVFSVLAIVAVLTKGNGFALALFVPLAVALSGTWRLLRNGAFWLPALLVPLFALPWYWLTYPLLSQGFRYHWGLDYSAQALPANVATIVAALGPVFALATLGGAVLALRRRDLLGLCLLADLLAVLLFQSLVPAALDARYLIAALPAALCLAADGIAAALAASRRAEAKALLLLGVAIGLLLPAGQHLVAARPRASFGMVEAAAAAAAQISPSNPVVVIVSDSHGEVAFAAEMALSDPARPSRFVIRGSRIFGAGGYNKFDYLPKYGSVAEIRAVLEAEKIPLIVLDQSAVARQWAHVDLLAQSLEGDAAHWRPVWSGASAEARRIRIFARSDMQSEAFDLARLTALSAPGHGLGR